jgi:hypothetical protein
MGHRRFLYGGHAKTIIPDKRKLVVLFENTSIRYSLSLSLHLYGNHTPLKQFEGFEGIFNFNPYIIFTVLLEIFEI